MIKNHFVTFFFTLDYYTVNYECQYCKNKANIKIWKKKKKERNIMWNHILYSHK